MSKCVQFRRGSADQHEEFTGAIGEVTMDTTNNTLRVHDGETAGGTVLAKKSDIPTDIMTADYVTETWRASDGSSWYRKYKSGWVEQGGIMSSGEKNITFKLEMADNKYSYIACGGDDNYGIHIVCTNKTTTGMVVKARTGTGTDFTNLLRSWRICGYVAE